MSRTFATRRPHAACGRTFGTPAAARSVAAATARRRRASGASARHGDEQAGGAFDALARHVADSREHPDLEPVARGQLEAVREWQRLTPALARGRPAAGSGARESSTTSGRAAPCQRPSTAPCASSRTARTVTEAVSTSMGADPACDERCLARRRDELDGRERRRDEVGVDQRAESVDQRIPSAGRPLVRAELRGCSGDLDGLGGAVERRRDLERRPRPTRRPRPARSASSRPAASRPANVPTRAPRDGAPALERPVLLDHHRLVVPRRTPTGPRVAHERAVPVASH